MRLTWKHWVRMGWARSSVAALSSCSVGGTAQLREFQSKEEGLLQLKEFHRKRSCSVETVGLLLAQPGGWHPLRFSFQQVDLVEKLLVGTVRVAERNIVRMIMMTIFSQNCW